MQNQVIELVMSRRGFFACHFPMNPSNDETIIQLHNKLAHTRLKNSNLYLKNAGYPAIPERMKLIDIYNSCAMCKSRQQPIISTPSFGKIQLLISLMWTLLAP